MVDCILTSTNKNNNKSKNLMIENIHFEAQRPALTVTPTYDEVTGQYGEPEAEFSTMKDEHDFNGEALDLETQEQPMAEQGEEDIHMYSIEEVDRLLEDSRDEPDQQLAEVSWNLELPDGVPGLDLVQVLSTRYLAGQMTYEQALDEAFSHGLSEQELLRAYSIYNAHYNKALNR